MAESNQELWEEIVKFGLIVDDDVKLIEVCCEQQDKIDRLREALKAALDYIQNGTHTIHVLAIIQEALQRAGGGE